MQNPLSIYQGKSIAILGLGRSGDSAARALHKAGAKVLAWDDHKIPKDTPYPIVNLHDRAFTRIDYLMLSPGIPPLTNPIALKAKASSVPLTCDIALFLKANPKPTVLGITGTNGKSTTTALCYHLLKNMGVTTAMGGNIGTPIMALPTLDKSGVYVLELSSYQLDLMHDPCLDSTVLLNITPDHLDRYGSMETYISSKARIFTLNQGHSFIMIDDAHNRALAEKFPNLTRLSYKKKLDVDFGMLRGEHNRQNAIAALSLCCSLGLNANQLTVHFSSFKGLAHRQELIAKHNNILFINDSKATNAQAALPALRTYKNIHWIVGGVSKEEGITPLLNDLQNVTYAYIIGQETAEIEAQLLPKVTLATPCTLESALNLAWKNVQKEQDECTVLLSPACASFDQFKNFEERGDTFRKLVSDIITHESSSIRLP